MAERTGIAWTDHTFNPWWGCMKVSPGCTNCYAETFANRTGHDIWGPAKTTARRTFGAKHWNEPLAWNKAAYEAGVRRRVFCASMADVFEDHPAVVGERKMLWDVIRATHCLDWQILTKRPESIARMLPADWGLGWSNVWLGTSVEDQDAANERIPALISTPAALRFLSCEPLLGPIDFYECGSRGAEDGDPCSFSALRGLDGVEPTIPGIDWVIVGGESGPKRRPMDLEWLRGIVTACKLASVPVFVKQDVAYKSGQRGRIPDYLWLQEFPAHYSGVKP